MNRTLIATALLAGAGLIGLGLAGAPRENPEAVALLTQIVELRQVRVTALEVQRSLTGDEPDRRIESARALLDLGHARASLARERADPAAERAAVAEMLDDLRALHADAERLELLDRGTLAELHVAVLEAELALVRLDE